MILDAILGASARLILERREAYERGYVVLHGAPSPTAHAVPTLEEIRAEIEANLAKAGFLPRQDFES